MRLTTKGRFAVTAMLDLALHSTKGPVTLAGISARQRISLSYLEQLFGKLRRRSLVESVRGPGGGYHLARDAGLLTVADIINAVEESIDSTQCGGKENCHDNQRCMTHDLWQELNETVHGFLSRVTLAQLVEKQRTRPVSVQAPRPRSSRSDGPTITV
jgi:Rrf2 family iron-sulfur cluster assembly transcriptional regulator